jgi:transcription initiation factor TFIID subunit 5
MTGHTSSVYSLAFSAESTLLVSGGADWTVRCWDVKAAGGLLFKMVNGDEFEGFALGSSRVNGHGSLGSSDREEGSIET